MRSFCTVKASLIFSTKNISVFGYKMVKHLMSRLLNELVKLMLQPRDLFLKTNATVYLKQAVSKQAGAFSHALQKLVFLFFFQQTWVYVFFIARSE